MSMTTLLAEHREDQSLSRFACSCGWTWPGDFREGYQPWLDHVAETIMPAIREAIAQEIEALTLPPMFVLGAATAARIVRGGTP